tara:strand:+ start:1942 stop:2706 length:765 start_codon:yes stop_codon:yes gene_type:complete
MKKILILLLFIINNTYGNYEKIEIKNFGIISIGNGENYIGKHQWNLSFYIEDSLFKFYIKSNSNDRYIFFNLSKLLNIKYLNYLNQFETNYVIKKDEKIVFNDKSKINLNPKNIFTIFRKKAPTNLAIKGKIIDSYALDNLEDYYYFIRTIIDNKLLCWVIVKNNQIMNVHTETNNNKYHNLGRITITNFINKINPEFTFTFKNEDEKKIISLGEKSKYISSFSKNNLKTPSFSKIYDHLEYRGFIFYSYKKNG